MPNFCLIHHLCATENAPKLKKVHFKWQFAYLAFPTLIYAFVSSLLKNVLIEVLMPNFMLINHLFCDRFDSKQKKWITNESYCLFNSFWTNVSDSKWSSKLVLIELLTPYFLHIHHLFCDREDSKQKQVRFIWLFAYLFVSSTFWYARI